MNLKRVTKEISGSIPESNNKKQRVEKNTSNNPKVNPNNTIVPIRDVFSYVVDFLTYEDRLTLRSINKETEKLITTPPFFNKLTIKEETEVIDLQMLEFAIAKNLRITIKIYPSAESIQKIIDFLSSNNEMLKIINKITITQGCLLRDPNIVQIQELFNFISNNNNNLINITRINIERIVACAESCQINIPNSLPINITNLNFSNILHTTLNLPDTLPTKLNTLNLSSIAYSTIQFQQSLSAPALEKIKFFSTDESLINCPDTITASALKSISFFHIKQSTIKCPSKIENAKPFINFSHCGRRGNSQINIPETLLKDISALTYECIQNTTIKEQLKNCQEKIEKLRN